MQNFRELLDRQKTYFDTDVTKSYEWRIDQLARMERMLKGNTEVAGTNEDSSGRKGGLR